MTKTAWFPAGKDDPVHAGWYETNLRRLDGTTSFYCYWTGSYWALAENGEKTINFPWPGDKWRGLTEPSA